MTKSPNQKNIRAHEKEKEHFDDAVLDRFKAIQKISEDTVNPISYGPKWSRDWEYGDFFEATKEHLELHFRVPPGCGCCVDDSIFINIPWWVWDDPSPANIFGWRVILAEAKSAKRDAEEKKKSDELELKQRLQYEQLKEKFKDA